MSATQSKRLLLIGGGGHCRSVLDAVLRAGMYDEIGIVDPDEQAGCPGVPVVGRDEDLPLLLASGWTDAFVTVGSIGNTARRRRLYRMIVELGFSVPVIIDPGAEVAGDVRIGSGSFIGKRAVVNAGSVIGDAVIINTGSVIEHTCGIGDFAHISPGSILCGQVMIGSDTHIGAGSVVRQGIEIGQRSIIGIGSVVVKNIPDEVVAFGNPCRVRRKIPES